MGSSTSGVGLGDCDSGFGEEKELEHFSLVAFLHVGESFQGLCPLICCSLGVYAKDFF